VIDVAVCDVYEDMNEIRTRSHVGHSTIAATRVEDQDSGTHRGFDWDAHIKLAIVLSVVAALVTIALAGRVSEPVLIVGVIVVASWFAWARVEPLAQPVRIPARHR
jgi:hypothetical protein